MFILTKKANKLPAAKNGPNGIWLFMPYFLPLKSIKKIPKTAPSQKENKNAKIVFSGPKIQPKPSANLASPKPIHFPLDTSHKIAKKEKNARPDKISNANAKFSIFNDQFSTKLQLSKKINNNADMLNSHTILLGMILCLKS